MTGLIRLFDVIKQEPFYQYFLKFKTLFFMYNGNWQKRGHVWCNELESLTSIWEQGEYDLHSLMIEKTDAAHCRSWYGRKICEKFKADRMSSQNDTMWSRELLRPQLRPLSIISKHQVDLCHCHNLPVIRTVLLSQYFILYKD